MVALHRSIALVQWALLVLTTVECGALTLDNSSQSEALLLARRQVITPPLFRRRAYHASTMVGSKIFLDGGQISHLSGNDVIFTVERNTLVLDLSSPWTAATATFAVIQKPRDVPILRYPELWYNAAQNELWQGFAGSASAWGGGPAPYPLSLWSLPLDSSGRNGTWRLALGERSSAFGALTRPFDGFGAHAGDSAYYLGGISDPLTTPQTASGGNVPLPGLVEFNMTGRTLRNMSAAAYHGTGTAQRGRMVHVPAYGARGLYVALGGDSSPVTGYTPGHNMKSFANITVYDPAARQWYHQTAWGEVPRPRLEPCVAVARSTNDTYEIFMYAGWGSDLGPSAVPFDEVYILSLPAFQWFRAPYTPRRPRHGHTCHIVGHRQLLSIGGVDSSQNKPYNESSGGLGLAQFATADEFPQGLGLFDITWLNFTSVYYAGEAPYEQSAPVASFYAQNSRYPAVWNSPALQGLMNPSIMNNSANRTTPAVNAQRRKPRLSAGGVAGVAIASAISIAALVAATILLVRRQRNRRNGEVVEAGSQGSIAELPPAQPAIRQKLDIASGAVADATCTVPGEMEATQQRHELSTS